MEKKFTLVSVILYKLSRIFFNLLLCLVQERVKTVCVCVFLLIWREKKFSAEFHFFFYYLFDHFFLTQASNGAHIKNVK